MLRIPRTPPEIEIMTNLMRWISRSVFRAAARAKSAHEGSFEYVDAARLGATDFRASATMRFEGAEFDDFCETLPSFTAAPLGRKSPIRGAARSAA